MSTNKVEYYKEEYEVNSVLEPTQYGGDIFRETIHEVTLTDQTSSAINSEGAEFRFLIPPGVYKLADSRISLTMKRAITEPYDSADDTTHVAYQPNMQSAFSSVSFVLNGLTIDSIKNPSIAEALKFSMLSQDEILTNADGSYPDVGGGSGELMTSANTGFVSRAENLRKRTTFSMPIPLGSWSMRKFFVVPAGNDCTLVLNRASNVNMVQKGGNVTDDEANNPFHEDASFGIDRLTLRLRRVIPSPTMGAKFNAITARKAEIPYSFPKYSVEYVSMTSGVEFNQTYSHTVTPTNIYCVMVANSALNKHSFNHLNCTSFRISIDEQVYPSANVGRMFEAFAANSENIGLVNMYDEYVMQHPKCHLSKEHFMNRMVIWHVEIDPNSFPRKTKGNLSYRVEFNAPNAAAKLWIVVQTQKSILMNSSSAEVTTLSGGL